MLKIETYDFTCVDLIINNQKIEMSSDDAHQEIYVLDDSLWITSEFNENILNISFDLDKNFIQSLKAIVKYMEAMYQDDQ